MVVLRDIGFESFCEHHMAPIIGSAHVGYLPTDRVVGISKLARVVDGFARRFQVQEKLTSQIAACIDEVLEATRRRSRDRRSTSMHDHARRSQTRRLDDHQYDARHISRGRQHARGVLALHRHRGSLSALPALISFACARRRGVPASESTEKLYLCFSPGCSAPTPTTWRAIFSPRSLVIEITTQYSQLSSRSGVTNRSLDAHRRLSTPSAVLAFAELNRRWCWHPGQIFALCRTTALQCGHTRVAPKVPARATLTASCRRPPNRV